MNISKKEASQLEGMVVKTNLKQEVYRKSVSAFALLKEVLKELADEYREVLKDKVDDQVLPVFQDTQISFLLFQYNPENKASYPCLFFQKTACSISVHLHYH